MNLSSRIVFDLLACSVLVHFAAEACHNAQHVAPTPEMGISGRKRREVSCANCTEDVDKGLSSFFTACLAEKRPGEFPSWRSVVEFVIRDTNWYHATDKDFCSGRKDSAKCWKRRVEYLLQYESELVNATKECIGDFDRSVKEHYGTDFEAFHNQYYDLYDYDLSDGEFRRTKRSEPISINDIKADVAWEIAKSCPSLNTVSYSECLRTDFDAKLRDLLPDYPSAKFIDLTSNDEFVQRHYSSCRITTQYVRGLAQYTENCYVSPSASASVLIGMQYKHGDIARIPSCIIFDYVEIVNQFSPVFSVYSNCETLAVNERSSSIADLRSSIPTTTAVTSTRSITTTVNLTANTTKRSTNTTDTVLPSGDLYYNFQVKKRIGLCNHGGKWSSYYNVDSPDGIGDMETLDNLRNIFGDQICQYPKAVEARVSNPPKSAGDTVFLSKSDGLRCFNHMQPRGSCVDYKVRFCCDMKQFECTGNHAWTEWLDRDRPKRGEYESLEGHLRDGNACPQPTNIKARIKNSRRPYWRGMNVLNISATRGLSCRRKDQIRRRMCKNYQVAFCCPR